MRSIEEKVEEHYKKMLETYQIRHYGKTEEINPTITKALKMLTLNPVGMEIISLIFKSFLKINMLDEFP